MQVGDAVSIEVLSAGEKRTVLAELASQPKVVPDEEETDYGFTVQEVTPSLYRRHRLNTREGVLVSFVDRGSEAAEAEMNTGDLIVGIGETSVGGIEEFRKAFDGLKPNAPFLIRALRGHETRYLLIVPGTAEVQAAPNPPPRTPAGS